MAGLEHLDHKTTVSHIPLFAAFEEGWAKVADGQAPAAEQAGDDADFAHSKNYSNADAHIASYGSYPTLYSNDKETQLEAVVDDRSAQDATADGAADSPGQSSNPGHHDDEEEESLMEQASEIAETAEEKAEEAVHQLAAAGNAAAEFVEESIGLDAAQEDQEAQNDASEQQDDSSEHKSGEEDRQRVLLEEGEKIAASMD